MWDPRQTRRALFIGAALLRTALLFFGECLESSIARIDVRRPSGGVRTVEVKFTDIDYKVYTDAADHVLHGRSPYERYTYRYSPLIAYICVPNLLCFRFFAKVVFCCADLGVALLIERCLLDLHASRKALARKAGSVVSAWKEESYPWHTFLLPCFCWLLHPLVATVSARGNADSLPCLLVLATLCALRRGRTWLAAVCFGLAVHLKIYPAVYGVPLLLHLQRDPVPQEVLSLPSPPKSDGRSGVSVFVRRVGWLLFSLPLAAVLIPFKVCFFLLRNMELRQWGFGCLSVATFAALGVFFWRQYGFPFVYESYLYHLVRSDHRHNFSVFFYLLYLQSADPVKGLSVALFVPQFACVMLVGCFFAKRNVEAALFLQTLLFVALNKVCTSQYFFWWLCLMPFGIAGTDMRKETLWSAFALNVGFLISLLIWLFFGYQLEFGSKPVFVEMTLASVVFVASQVGLVAFFIKQIRQLEAAASSVAPASGVRTVVSSARLTK